YVPCPVLFLVVPGQLVATDPVGAVIFSIKGAEEAEECIVILPDPVHIHRRKVILFEPAACKERMEIVPGPLVDLIIIGRDVRELRIGPADRQETVRVPADDRPYLARGHDIVRDGRDELGFTRCGAHRGKTIDVYHDTNQRPSKKGALSHTFG